MNPSEWDGAPPNEWAFGRGATDSKKIGAVSPSQEHDGEMTPEKIYNSMVGVSRNTRPTTAVTTMGEKHLGFQADLGNLRDKIT